MNINDIINGKVTEAQLNNASESDLLQLTESTIKKMLSQQKSDKYYPDRKSIYFDRVSNNWNADAKSIELYKDKVFINFYVQYSNTDTDDCEYLSKFLGSGDYRGAIQYTDMYDNPHTSYYTFDRHDKAKVMKAICLAYLKK